MKKITLTMIAVFALCGVSMAQTRGERGTRGNQQHNPEMMAERMTDRMAKEYELDDKQKAELLELNKEFASKTEMPRMRPHRQGRPQAKAQANPQGRRGFAAQPQRPMGERKELTDEQKAQFKAEAEKKMAERKEAQEKYDKKIKKIFTKKQYKAYEENKEKQEQLRKEGVAKQHNHKVNHGKRLGNLGKRVVIHRG